MEDDNYKYYKLIFGNVYIRKYIFNKVKELNGPNSKSIDEATITFICNNKYWNLFKYKVKIGSNFKYVINIDHLDRLFSGLKTHFINDKINKQEQDELIIQFFQNNKSIIINAFTGKYKENIKVFDILTKLISVLRNSTFLKLVFNEIFNNQNNNHNNRLLSEYDISKLYEYAIINGDIDIVSVLYNDIKLKFIDYSYISKKALFWSIQASNRNEMVNYLLDNLGYTVPTTSLYGIYDNFFQNLIKLHHNLLKRIMKLGSPLLYNETVLFHNILFYSKSLSPPPQSANKIIDFIQNSIYVSIHNRPNIHNFTEQEFLNFNNYYEKINLLIEYNNSLTNGTSSIESIDKNKLIHFENNNNTNNNNTNNNGGNSYFNFIKSVFKASSLPIQQTSTIIKFEEFNLEREVKRIYIFDFLKSNYNRLPDKNVYSSFVINYSSFFNEYELILELISFEMRKKQEMNGLKNDIGVEKGILSKCLHVASENADSKLLNFIINNLNCKLINIGVIGFDHSTTSNQNILFDKNQIPINRQIEYLQTIVTLNINFPLSFKVILNHILKKSINNNNNQSLSIENLHQIRDIINQFIQLHKDKDIDNCFLSNYLCMSRLTMDSSKTVIDYFNKNKIIFKN